MLNAGKGDSGPTGRASALAEWERKRLEVERAEQPGDDENGFIVFKTVTGIREVIVTHGSDGFPTDALQEAMVKRGKSLVFADEEIDELVEMQYGDKRLFALLSRLFPFVDVTNHHFHVDHVFP